MAALTPPPRQPAAVFDPTRSLILDRIVVQLDRQAHGQTAPGKTLFQSFEKASEPIHAAEETT